MEMSPKLPGLSILQSEKWIASNLVFLEEKGETPRWCERHLIYRWGEMGSREQPALLVWNLWAGSCRRGSLLPGSAVCRQFPWHPGSLAMKVRWKAFPDTSGSKRRRNWISKGRSSVQHAQLLSRAWLVCDSMDYSPPGFSARGISCPGKNTGVGHHRHTKTLIGTFIMGPITGKEIRKLQSTKGMLAHKVYDGVGIGDGI